LSFLPAGKEQSIHDDIITGPLLVNTWPLSVKRGWLKALFPRILVWNSSTEMMKTYYQITAEGIGIVLLRKRKIAKALRRWLREKGLSYEYVFYIQ